MPRPRQDGVARRHVRRDGEVQVTRPGRRAVANDALDDRERLGTVRREADLAGTPAVVGTAGDGHVALGADGKGGGGRAAGRAQQGLVALAREIGAVGLEWCDHGVVCLAGRGVGVEFTLKGWRELDFHVRRRSTQKGKEEGC